MGMNEKSNGEDMETRMGTSNAHFVEAACSSFTSARRSTPLPRAHFGKSVLCSSFGFQAT